MTVWAKSKSGSLDWGVDRGAAKGDMDAEDGYSVRENDCEDCNGYFVECRVGD